jgi:sulfoxide reductase heme-binding subunit YedZ
VNGVVLAASSKATWYLTRGTGLVTLLLLTASMVLGVVTTVRWKSPRWPRFITAALHRNVSLLVVVFLVAHVLTSVIDSFAPIHWLDIVVPVGATYRPLWLGLGALAVDQLVAVTITSLVRQRLGYGVWRVVHWTSYACWPAALLHGLGTGSDTKLGWVLVLNLACVAAVVGAVSWRLAVGWPAAAGTRVALGAVTVVGAIVLLAWLFNGPTRPGWARRAGTPPSLLSGAAADANAGPGSG